MNDLLINVFVTIINFLLTIEARGPYWGILARGRGSTDRAQRGPYKNDRGPIFPSTARASSVSKLFIIWLFNYLLLCFCKPVIGPWALRENNALQFSHN